MKKFALFLALLLVVGIFLSSCSEKALPSGRASTVRVMDRDGWINLGSGEYEFISDTTVKFICDDDSKTYFLSMHNIMYIVEE